MSNSEPAIFAFLRQAEMQKNLMRLTIQIGVPNHMERLRHRGGPSDFDWEQAQAFSEILAEKGDLLMFLGERRGQSARIMTDLIKAVATMAFLPGGITFLDVHFDAGTPDSSGHVCCVTGPLFGKEI